MNEWDVDGMLESMPLRLFYEWMEYYRRYSFGDELANLRNAMACCITANANRGKGQRAFKIDDFIPKFKTNKKKQTPEQMNAIFKAFAIAHNTARKKVSNGNDS